MFWLKNKLLAFLQIRWQFAILIFLTLFVLLGMLAGFAAANTVVVANGASDTSHSMTAEQLKPAACTMTLTTIIVPSGGQTATQGNDLILGTGGNDSGGNRLNGKGGDDCIIGGAGNDSINGGQGNDIILGGGGNDDLSGGPGDDHLDGGAGADSCNVKHGSDTTSDCETIIN